jgi:hypothetical protein
MRQKMAEANAWKTRQQSFDRCVALLQASQPSEANDHISMRRQVSGSSLHRATRGCERGFVALTFSVNLNTRARDFP